LATKEFYILNNQFYLQANCSAYLKGDLKSNSSFNLILSKGLHRRYRLTPNSQVRKELLIYSHKCHSTCMLYNSIPIQGSFIAQQITSRIFIQQETANLGEGLLLGCHSHWNLGWSIRNIHGTQEHFQHWFCHAMLFANGKHHCVSVTLSKLCCTDIQKGGDENTFMYFQRCQQDSMLVFWSPLQKSHFWKLI
jgi:hypothetical protein